MIVHLAVPGTEGVTAVPATEMVAHLDPLARSNLADWPKSAEKFISDLRGISALVKKHAATILEALQINQSLIQSF